MSLNKFASFRYRIIDHCFQQPGKEWSLPGLQEEIARRLSEFAGSSVSISGRQVQDDFRVMRSLPPEGFDAPIVCRKGLYRYENAAFSIFERPLTTQDLQQLQEALSILQQFEGLPHVEIVTGLIERLRQGRLSNTDFIDEPIQLETNREVAGLAWISPLYKAIKGNRSLLVNYQPFAASEPVRMIVHPLQLKEYRNRWFLLGWDENLNSIRTLALDRIQDTEVVEDTAKNSMRAPLNNRFSHLIGVSVPETNPEPVMLRVVAGQVPYLLTKPLHASQRAGETFADGSRLFTFQLQLNFELESELMALGERVEVVAPQMLRSRIAQRLKLAVAAYSG